MPTLPQRIAAIEQRRHDTMHAALKSVGIQSDPAEAERVYRDFIGEAAVPTADDSQRRHPWGRLSPEQAKNVYLAFASNPHFDIEKAVALILEGRP